MDKKYRKGNDNQSKVSKEIVPVLITHAQITSEKIIPK